jgi:hypothetical protein
LTEFHDEVDPMKDGDDRSEYYRGLIHVHSAYSHDGRDSLAYLSSRLGADGFDFCVLTDHFEDLDAARFDTYLADVEAVNGSHNTIILAAVEAEVGEFHVIFLPATSYDEILQIVQRGTLSDANMLKLLVHPSKHGIGEVAEFLRGERLEGLELWNQRADGSYLPPAEFIRGLLAVTGTSIPAVFFGADLHNVEHRASNVMLIPRRAELTPELVVRTLTERDFVNYNRNAQRLLPASSSPETICAWLDDVAAAAGFKSKARWIARKQLRTLYHFLPRSAKVRINSLKNGVKSRL